jgi:hypothetical protein
MQGKVEPKQQKKPMQISTKNSYSSLCHKSSSRLPLFEKPFGPRLKSPHLNLRGARGFTMIGRSGATDPTSLVPLYLLENSTSYKLDIAVDTADSASRAARNMGHILAARPDTERHSSTGCNQ